MNTATNSADHPTLASCQPRRQANVAGLLAGSLAGALLLATAGTALAQSPTTDPTVIAIQSRRFVAAPEVIVPAGTSITWVNQDGATHDIVANDLAFASPLLTTGETFSFTFASPGSYRYICDLHEGMTGVVTVIAAAGSDQAA